MIFVYNKTGKTDCMVDRDSLCFISNIFRNVCKYSKFLVLMWEDLNIILIELAAGRGKN